MSQSGDQLMNSERAKKLAGFDVVPFVRKAKNRLRMEKVSLGFTHRSIQATAEHDGRGTCVITIPTKRIVQKKLGLDNNQTTLKLKTAILEEQQHCLCHETLHQACVVHGTIRAIKRNLTKQEQRNPFVRMKIAGLLRAKKEGK